MNLTLTSVLLIFAGLFLVGGVISFVKRGLKLAALVVAVLAVLALASGMLRL